MVRLIHDDCISAMRKLQPCSVHSVVTDPPAGIGFMNKEWDSDKGGRNKWITWMRNVMWEANRVLKPGGHILVWAIPRTSHWTALAVENAGFEIRDVVVHLFGTGFPKSHNISKAIDAKLGAKRKLKRMPPRPETSGNFAGKVETRPFIEKAKIVGYHETADETPITRQSMKWNGWGTALKPSAEHWILAMKPIEGDYASNVLKYGTGGLNIDASRIKYSGKVKRTERLADSGEHVGPRGWKETGRTPNRPSTPTEAGRFPANTILSGSAVTMIDKQKDGASRFFYTAKPSNSERDDGIDPVQIAKNIHPTCKSIKLMKYLVRLITPPGGIVLDPFMGSGTTGIASVLLGNNFIGIEKERAYFRIANARINKHVAAKIEKDRIKERYKKG